MSYLDDFNVWKDQIENFPSKDVKLPNQPIDDFVASVETLAVDANEDRKALAGAGLDVALIDQLNPLSGALRYCQAQWMSIFQEQQEAQAQWKEQSPEAYDLRKELLHHFAFAYRNTELSQKESTVREYGRYVFWKDDEKRGRYILQ